MPVVKRAIVIQAPVATVYTFIADTPERMVEWWPPIERQDRVTPPPTHLGSISRYTYNMLGIRIKGEHKVVAMERNSLLRVQTTSGINSTFVFKFTLEEPCYTALMVEVDYQLPGAIISQLLHRAVIERSNEENLERGLTILKSLLEQAQSTA